MRKFFLLFPVALLAACATPISSYPTMPTRAPEPARYPAPRVTTRRPPARAAAPVRQAKRAARTTAPRPASAHRPASTHRSASAHRSKPARATGYVRLRGTVEIHLPTCPRVLRAHPDGVIPARKSDGPPCYHCRKAEAIAQHLVSHPATVRRAASPAPVRSRTPARTPRYVRLRGTVEIHLSTCPLVLRAHPDGVIPARKGDGPPCYRCRKSEAMAWSR